MRLWSLHPKYLDKKGLVALWREALLAKRVLEGKTMGYKNHSQLLRFRELQNPVAAINQYLSHVYSEAVKRNYNFDKQKISWNFTEIKMNVTSEQLSYEVLHLRKKLETRDKNKLEELKKTTAFETHPLFRAVAGQIEKWENIKGDNKIEAL
ncbi:MAG TPA: pyrimidine dimer DNA glycosylase/endonuclease V [Bacteroidales bacterium]|nr:pyrimidine dimer DNA glycosylase/endonuclease V [Bacteroidales bacterium]